MLKMPERFDRHFSKALALLPDDYARMRFLAAMVTLMEDCVGEELAIHFMEDALAISQGIGAAIVPQQQQEKLFLVKR